MFPVGFRIEGIMQESYWALLYMVIRSDVAAEAGAGRDEANRVRTK